MGGIQFFGRPYSSGRRKRPDFKASHASFARVLSVRALLSLKVLSCRGIAHRMQGCEGATDLGEHLGQHEEADGSRRQWRHTGSPTSSRSRPSSSRGRATPKNQLSSKSQANAHPHHCVSRQPTRTGAGLAGSGRTNAFLRGAGCSRLGRGRGLVSTKRGADRVLGRGPERKSLPYRGAWSK